LADYLSDPDLEGVRSAASRHDWNPAEISAWDTFWAELRQLKR